MYYCPTVPLSRLPMRSTVGLWDSKSLKYIVAV